MKEMEMEMEMERWIQEGSEMVKWQRRQICDWRGPSSPLCSPLIAAGLFHRRLIVHRPRRRALEKGLHKQEGNRNAGME